MNKLCVHGLMLACLFAASLIATPSSAKVIARISGDDMDTLSANIESLYAAVVAKGTFPVEVESVGEGERIEDVLRRRAPFGSSSFYRSSFEGSYFPKLLDAITCDLNGEVCHRDFSLSDSSSNDGKTAVQISTPLQLKPTKGNWSVSPGQKIFIPSLAVNKNIVSKTAFKSSKQSLSKLLEDNEVCTEHVDDCISMAYFMNYNIAADKIDSFSGEISVPAYEYIISIPDDCSVACATTNSLISVDLHSGRFLDLPYYVLMTSGVDKTAIEKFFTKDDVDGYSSTPENINAVKRDDFTFDGLPGTLAGRLVPKSGPQIPRELSGKIDIGESIIERGQWTTAKKFSPFSAYNDTGQNSRIGMTAKLRERINELPNLGGTRQAVMIIDGYFDQKHCEFGEQELVVYDCTNSDGSGKDCKTTDSEFSYPTQHGLVASADRVQLTDENVKGKCGKSGHMDEVQVEEDSEEAVALRHGTHLAGIIGARSDDDFGTSGVNPTAKIVGVRFDRANVDDADYGLWLLAQLNRIIFKEAVRVVDFSAGYQIPRDSQVNGDASEHRDWLTTLISSRPEVLFVVASGNHQDSELQCDTMPACLSGDAPNVVSVVGLDSNLIPIAQKSNLNPKFTLGAEGSKVMGPLPLNKYGTLSGSSQAAAFVAGAANLSMSTGAPARWSPLEMKNRLIACSDFTSSSSMNWAEGGALNVDCLIGGQTHYIVSGQIDGTVAVVAQLTTGAGELQFHDLDTDKDKAAGWEDVIALSRIPNTDDVILFLGEEGYQSKEIKRKLVALAPSQQIRIRTPSGTKSVDLDDVNKFVKKTGT